MDNMLSIRSFFLSFLLLIILVSSCAKYERQVVPFQLPSAMPNATQVSGATLAAKAYNDKKTAESDFGFDILDPEFIQSRSYLTTGEFIRLR